MLNSIVKWSIAQRWLVVIASILISVWGFLVLTQMSLDVGELSVQLSEEGGKE